MPSVEPNNFTIAFLCFGFVCCKNYLGRLGFDQALFCRSFVRMSACFNMNKLKLLSGSVLLLHPSSNISDVSGLSSILVSSDHLDWGGIPLLFVSQESRLANSGVAIHFRVVLFLQHAKSGGAQTMFEGRRGCSRV